MITFKKILQIIGLSVLVTGVVHPPLWKQQLLVQHRPRTYRLSVSI